MSRPGEESSPGSKPSTTRSTPSRPPRRGASSGTPSRRYAKPWGTTRPSRRASATLLLRPSTTTNRAAFADRLPAPWRPRPAQATYVGIDALLGRCHLQLRARSGTRRAHARRLCERCRRSSKEFNLECVSCHVTGYERPGGSTVTHVDKLQNVQCEVCHGAGSKHVANPVDKALIVAKPSPRRVPRSCHHPPHVGGHSTPGRG